MQCNVIISLANIGTIKVFLLTAMISVVIEGEYCNWLVLSNILSFVLDFHLL